MKQQNIKQVITLWKQDVKSTTHWTVFGCFDGTFGKKATGPSFHSLINKSLDTKSSVCLWLFVKENVEFVLIQFSTIHARFYVHMLGVKFLKKMEG